MTDLDHPYSSNGGGGEHRPGLGPSMPFFPAPPVGGTAGATSAPAVPPPPAPPAPVAPPAATVPPPAIPVAGEMGRHSGLEKPAPAPSPAPAPAPAEPTGRGAQVKGQIKIEDEVVEKIAALAALEVAGVAGLGSVNGPASETLEAVRQRIGMGDRVDRGVQARVTDNEIALDLSLIVEYGSIVLDVAKTVRTNVARIVSLMLGMKVASVNVTIDDVKMPDTH